MRGAIYVTALSPVQDQTSRWVWDPVVPKRLWIGTDGGVERIGAYVKELSAIDYDLPILNKALVDYMVKKIPIEQTINQCNDLII